jgi:hypothetical protein
MSKSPVLFYVLELAEGNSSPETLEWLRAGFRGWLDGESDLPAALGLNATHSRGGRYGAARLAMLRHLHRAADLIGEPDGWQTAKALAGEIKRFRRYRWPRLRDVGSPPAGVLTPVESAILEAFRVSGGKVPESETGIYRALTNTADKSGSFAV